MKKIMFIMLLLPLIGKGQIITTIAGNGDDGYSGDDSLATIAKLYNPSCAIIGPPGNVCIVDYYNHRIRKVDNSGTIVTIAGNGIAGFAGDGGQATNASLNYPYSAVMDVTGIVYIADQWNNRIRKIDTFGIISTIAGSGPIGFSAGSYSGDGGVATDATLFRPLTIAIDTTGNLYIADYNNVVRKINTSGIISTIAGNDTAGFAGDGVIATSAKINDPYSMAFDNIGNLYIADHGNNRIRKINTSGIVSTFAGNGTAGFSGDGGMATDAQILTPTGVIADPIGNVYIADNGNNRIRKVDSTGMISTIVGTGIAGYNSDGISATLAELNTLVFEHLFCNVFVYIRQYIVSSFSLYGSYGYYFTNS